MADTPSSGNEIKASAENAIKPKTILIKTASPGKPKGATGRIAISAEPVMTPPTTQGPKYQTSRLTIEAQAAAAPSAAPAQADNEDPKSKTARIDLPSELREAAPQIRRKTIKIKRADSAVFTKAPRISTAAPEESAVDEVELPAILPGEEVPSPAFSFMGIVAAVAAILLVYVLAAQTVAPGLPFPGRI